MRSLWPMARFYDNVRLGILAASLQGREQRMSRIFDAIRDAERARASQSKASEKERQERRKVRRFTMRVPVFVYGHGASQEPFHEETTSLIVNANGALLALAHSVVPGETLLLTNPATRVEQSCRVIHLRATQSHQSEVGVAFENPSAEFWPLPEESIFEKFPANSPNV